MSLQLERSCFEWIAPMLQGAVAANILTDSGLESNVTMLWRDEERNIKMTMSQLGKGSFGNVWKFELTSSWIPTRTKSVSYAMKFIHPDHVNSWYTDYEGRVLRELLSMHENQNILTYFGVFRLKVGVTWTVVCMQRCEGALNKFVDSHVWENLGGHGRIACCWDIVRQILTGLQACHSMDTPLWHRDMKMSNIFYDPVILPDGRRSYSFKIGDFGLSRTVSPGQERSLSPFPSPGINSHHQDPALSSSSYTSSIDLYGVADIIHSLVRHLHEVPDPQFSQLHILLRNNECDLQRALDIATTKCWEMTELPV